MRAYKLQYLVATIKVSEILDLSLDQSPHPEVGTTSDYFRYIKALLTADSRCRG